MTTMFDFTLIKETFQYIEVFGQNWFVVVAITIAIMLMLTRDSRSMAILFLPIITGLRIIGMQYSNVVFSAFATIGTIVFLTSTLSVEIMGNVLRTGVSSIVKKGKDVFTARKTIEKQFGYIPSKTYLKDFRCIKLDALKSGATQERINKLLKQSGRKSPDRFPIWSEDYISDKKLAKLSKDFIRNPFSNKKRITPDIYSGDFTPLSSINTQESKKTKNAKTTELDSNLFPKNLKTLKEKKDNIVFYKLNEINKAKFTKAYEDALTALGRKRYKKKWKDNKPLLGKLKWN